MYRTTSIFCQFTGVNLIELNWLGHNKILLLYLVVEGCALPYMVVHAYEDLLASILLFMLCMSAVIGFSQAQYDLLYMYSI